MLIFNFKLGSARGERVTHAVPTVGSITHHTISAATFVLCHSGGSSSNSNTNSNGSNKSSDNLTPRPDPSEPMVALFMVLFSCCARRCIFKSKWHQRRAKSSRYTAGIIFHGRTCRHRHLPFTPFTPGDSEKEREQISETI